MTNKELQVVKSNWHKYTAAEQTIVLDKMMRDKKLEDTRNSIYSILADFPGRYVVLIGGSGSGKSYEIADHIIDRIEDEPKSRILCLRAEGKQVSLSQFPLIRSRVKANHKIENYKINEAKGSEKIQYKANAEVLFSGLDKQHCPV